MLTTNRSMFSVCHSFNEPPTRRRSATTAPGPPYQNVFQVNSAFNQGCVAWRLGSLLSLMTSSICAALSYYCWINYFSVLFFLFFYCLLYSIVLTFSAKCTEMPDAPRNGMVLAPKLDHGMVGKFECRWGKRFSSFFL